MASFGLSGIVVSSASETEVVLAPGSRLVGAEEPDLKPRGSVAAFHYPPRSDDSVAEQELGLALQQAGRQEDRS
jgi:hypothetical protein